MIWRHYYTSEKPGKEIFSANCISARYGCLYVGIFAECQTKNYHLRRFRAGASLFISDILDSNNQLEFR